MATPAAPLRAHTRILIVNECQQVTINSLELAQLTESIARQAREFADAWGIAGVSIGHALPATAARHAAAGDVETVIALLDDADQADALGYHAEDEHGVPYGRVFAATCQTNGVSVSSCLSHEVLEALADLNVDRWVTAPDGRAWALEVCDPVEALTYVDAAGVELSNYVLPAYFDDTPPPGARFDRLARLTGPFTLSRGGYAVITAAGRVSQIFGDRVYYDRFDGWRHQMKASELSRTARRLAAGNSAGPRA